MFLFLMFYVLPCLTLLYAASVHPNEKEAKDATLVAFLPVLNLLSVILGIYITFQNRRNNNESSK